MSLSTHDPQMLAASWHHLFATSQPLLVTDAALRITFANPAAAELLTDTTESLSGRSLREFIAPADHPGLTNIARDAPEPRLLRIQRLDGSQVVCYLSSRAHPAAGGSITHVLTPRAGILHADVVSTTPAYQQIVQSVNDVIYHIDAEGRWAFLNAAWTDLTGYSVSEALGTAAIDVVYSIDRPQARAYFRSRVVGHHQRGRYCARYRIYDGSLRWVDIHTRFSYDSTGTLLGVTGSVRDITERKQIEDEVAAARDTWMRLFNHFPLPVWRTDTVGNCNYVNQTWLDFAGTRAEAAFGRGWLDLVHPDDHATCVDHLRAVFHAQAPVNVEYRMRRHDGEYRWVAVYGQPWTTPEGTFGGYIGILHDITEQLQMIQFRESRRYFFEQLIAGDTLLRVLDTLVLAIEQQLSDSLCSILLLDEQHTAFVEYAAPSLPSSYMQAIMGLPVGPTAGSCGTAAFRNQTVIVSDIANDPLWMPWRDVALAHNLRACWAVPFHDGSGAVCGTFAIYYTASRRPAPRELALVEGAAHLASIAVQHRRAEAVLRTSEARHRALVEAIPDMLFLVDVDGTYLDCNIPSTTPNHLASAQIIGRTVHDVLPPDVAPKALHAIQNTIQRGGIVTIDYQLTIKGVTHEYEARIAAYNATEAIVVVRDTTEQKYLEAQLLQARKMESIGRLAGGIAHDFNNVLTAISGAAELALLSLPTGSPIQIDLEDIRHAVQRATSLTRQLLTFARKHIISPQRVDVNALIIDMDHLLSRLIGENIEVVTLLDPALDLIQADVGQIEQVVINLVINARDAMPNGGVLNITTANAAMPHPASIFTGPCVRLTIDDTGTGMSDDVKAHIFEPFFTTKASGTGLGLATCYGIVQQHGGHISVVSHAGRGTTVTVEFPRSALAATPSEREVATSVGPAYQGDEVLLVVEDEAMVRSLAVRVLRTHGYTVLEATNGSDALQVIETAAAPIDLLITDVVMPKLGGNVLAREVQHRWPTTRVLFISGYADDERLRRDVQRGNTRLLPKPFSATTLLQIVREVLDEARGEESGQRNDR